MISLYPLLIDKMLVDRTNKGELYYIYSKDGQLHPLRKGEVLHIPGLGSDGLIGYSPIAMAKNFIVGDCRTGS